MAPSEEDREQYLLVIDICEDERQILHFQYDDASLLELHLYFLLNRISWGDSSLWSTRVNQKMYQTKDDNDTNRAISWQKSCENL